MMFWKKSLIYCAFLLIPKLSKLPCRAVDSYQMPMLGKHFIINNPDGRVTKPQLP